MLVGPLPHHNEIPALPDPLGLDALDKLLEEGAFAIGRVRVASAPLGARSIGGRVTAC